MHASRGQDTSENNDFSSIDSPHSHFNNLQAILNRILQIWIQFISPSYEPKVWKSTDRQGRTVNWRVFDPETGYLITFSSEMEVRLWLEQRHYR
jgi:hypothetical protein